MPSIEQMNAMSDVGDLRTLFQQPEKRAEEKKPKGNNILSLLPSAAAAAASFIPGVGTIAGGLIGGAGEAGRQLLSGEDFDLGKVGREAALSAVPFALGKAGKIVGGVKDAIKAGEGVAGATKAAGAAIAPITTARKTAVTTGEPTSSLLDKFKTNAQRTSQEGFGLKVGQNEGRGKVLTPDQATDKFNFITEGSKKYGGIRAGKPADQAADAQNVFNNVTKSLDDTLTKINRPLDPTELVTIGQGITERIGKNALITGKSSPTAQKLIQELQGATDLKALEAVRRKADDIAFTQSGAGKTSSAAQAKDVRDAIDEFITPLSAEYKAVKGDYMKAKDALTSTSKASAGARGVKIPLVDIEVAKQAVPGVINKGASLATSSGSGSILDKVKKGAKFGVEMGKQGLTRMVAAPIAYPGETATPEEAADPLASAAGLTQATQAPVDAQGGITQQQLMAAVAADPKNADTYITLYKLFNDGGASKKPLSAESAKTLSNAQAGLTAIDQIESQLSNDPGIQQRGGISGTFNPFGLTAGALGTGEYENARGQARDIIARIRTGAALTADEAKAFDKFLPQPGDTQATVQQKLGTLRSQFQFIVDNAGGAGTDLAQSL